MAKKPTVSGCSSRYILHTNNGFIGSRTPYLVQIHRIQVQCIESICLRVLAPSPFLHLGRAEIVRGVDVSSLEITRLVSLKGSTLALRLLILEELEATG